MEQQPLPAPPENGVSVYEFKYVDPERHSELLRSVTLDPNQVNEAWLVALDEAIVAGGDPIRTNMTLREVQRITQGREHFFELLGWDQPEHPLYKSYTSVTVPRPRKTAPSINTINVFNLLEVLHEEIGPDTQRVIQKYGRLLEASSSNVRRRIEYGKRVATALYWSGNIAELIRMEPRVLIVSRQKLGVLARIAADHAEHEDRQLGEKSVGQFIASATIEQRLLTIVDDQEYRLADTVSLGHQRTRTTAISTDELLEKTSWLRGEKQVGIATMRAYFRGKSPNLDMQQRYPHIRKYLPINKHREKIDDPASPIITGQEPWLSETPIPKRPGADRKDWLLTMNHYIATGSQPMRSRGGEKSALEHDRIHDARFHVFGMLGWDNENHVLYSSLARHLRNEPRPINPANIIGVLNTLSEHDIAPVINVLKSHFAILRHSPKDLETKIQIIEDLGFDTRQLLTTVNASILRFAPERMQKELEKKIASGDEKYLRVLRSAHISAD